MKLLRPMISPFFVLLIGICIYSISISSISCVTASSSSSSSSSSGSSLEERESDDNDDVAVVSKRKQRELNLRAHMTLHHEAEVDGLLTLADDDGGLTQPVDLTPLQPSTTCHSENAVRNNDLTIADVICSPSNERFLGNLCNMIKASPPILNLLNGTYTATDLEELDLIPGFDRIAFEALVDQFSSSSSREGVVTPQFTVYAPDNAALRDFARQTLDYLIDLEDPEIVEFIAENDFEVNSDRMVDTFFMSPQGRLCRDSVSLNHIAMGGISYDDLECGDTTYMLGGDSTVTECYDDDFSLYRRDLQQQQQQQKQRRGGDHHQHRIGTSKSQFGMGNIRNNLDANKEYTEPRIIDPDYLVSNGFVHVVNAVCLPIVDKEIAYETIAEIDRLVDDTVYGTTVFDTCDCPLSHGSSPVVPDITPPVVGRATAVPKATEHPTDRPSSGPSCVWSESRVVEWARDVFGSENCTRLSDSVRCFWNNYEYYGRRGRSLRRAEVVVAAAAAAAAPGGGDHREQQEEEEEQQQQQQQHRRDLQFRTDTEIRYGFFLDVSSEELELFVAGRSYGDGLFPVLDGMIGDNTHPADPWDGCFGGDDIVEVFDEIHRFIENPIAVPSSSSSSSSPPEAVPEEPPAAAGRTSPPPPPDPVRITFTACGPDCRNIQPRDPTFLDDIKRYLCPNVIDMSRFSVTVESVGICRPCGDDGGIMTTTTTQAALGGGNEGTEMGVLCVSDDPNFTEEGVAEALAENADGLNDAFDVLFGGRTTTVTLAPSRGPTRSPVYSPPMTQKSEKASRESDKSEKASRESDKSEKASRESDKSEKKR